MNKIPKNKKAMQLSINMLVIITLGIFAVVFGIIFAGKLMNFLPNQEEMNAPALFKPEVYPEKAPAGTIFNIKVTAPKKADVYSIAAYIGGDSFALYDDGNHGDGAAGDKVYAGAWDSGSSNETGALTGELQIYGSGGQATKGYFYLTLIENSCREILRNGAADSKFDVVVLGQGYETLENFDDKVLEYLDLDADNGGLFSASPLKEEINRFNFYSINKLLSFEDLGCEVGCRGVPSLVCCKDKAVSRFAADCPADNIIILINNDAFCGSASSYAKVCTGGANTPMVLMHEFGHTFGKLGDEYSYGVYPGMPKIKNYNFPNCVADCAKWPAGVSAGCFAGCGYSEYFRSAEKDSIMYTYVPVFNAVSVYNINKILANYLSGKIADSSELPAPAGTGKKYAAGLNLKEGALSSDEIYVAPGEAADRKAESGEEGYEAKLISFGGEILYSSNFKPVAAEFPFYEQNSTERYPAIYADDINYTLDAPYFENAEKMEIYNIETGEKVLEVDLGYLSKTCGDGICEKHESAADCRPDCDVQEDKICTSATDSVCDSDCPWRADADCGQNWMPILGIAIILVSTAIIVVIVIKAVRWNRENRKQQ